MTMPPLDHDLLSPHEAVLLARQTLAGIRGGTGDVTLDATLRTARYLSLRRSYLTRDPDIRGGAVILRGTRITAASVAARVDYGDSIPDIAAENPDLPAEAFEVALTFATAHRPDRQQDQAA